jgi:ubiquinone/menaquinone biosynthesis C-methylase UbiE
VGGSGEHFDRLAPRYTALRSPAEVDSLTPIVAELAQLRGGRVLDVGCGSGSVVRQLAAGYSADAVGLDRSSEMVETARREGASTYVVGRAEELRFPNASFDVVLARLTVHHLDRPRAFAEIRRVLRPGGRLVITTTDPAGFPSFWMQAYFPSYARTEQSRFPDADTLRRELLVTSFAEIAVVPHVLPRRFSREEAIAKLRGRAYSTFVHMSEEEYEAGVAAAEALLPKTVEYDLRLLHVVAVTPPARAPSGDA